MINRFLEQNKGNWERLEDLLGMLRGNSLRGLSRLEVREFGELYRRAAADLAIARAETRDPKLINYLNSLVIRAHGKIYRAESNGAHLITQFFSRDLPETVRNGSRYILLATVVFMATSIFSGVLSYNNPEFAITIGVEETADAAKAGHKWWQSLNDANQVGASGILTNNIRVAFLAFAWGALLGVGSLYVLTMNGVSIGGVVGACYRGNAEFATDLLTFMVGHGVLELSAIFMAAGAGMMIGYAIIDPGDLTRGQALKKKGAEAVRIVIGCAVILVIAGIIEGFISPADIPAPIKVAVGVGSGIAMLAYFLLAGRNEKSPDAESEAV
ncbi:MAG TPA: stage II sporulation protein M [Pyrinomonadaceae bacterium]|nr:stage II sporulation protein M [Pyrinomonadaceae bacterium]